MVFQPLITIANSNGSSSLKVHDLPKFQPKEKVIALVEVKPSDLPIFSSV